MREQGALAPSRSKGLRHSLAADGYSRSAQALVSRISAVLSVPLSTSPDEKQENAGAKVRGTVKLFALGSSSHAERIYRRAPCDSLRSG